MKLTTPMTITAADSESRTITGRIVAFEEPANASTGKVVFAKGSIQPKDVLLNLEHDRTRRIAKPLSIALSEDQMSINATFKVANTTAGNDALIEASEGLRDGFSIELAVDDYSHFGFALESREQVDSIAARARVAGCLVWEPRDEPFPVGYYCGLRDPAGNYVEFSYGQPLGPGAEQIPLP